VSSVQFKFKPIKSFNEFASNIEDLVNEAKGSDIIVFPEVITFELLFIIQDYNLSKVNMFTNEYINLFEQLSKEKKQLIIAGSHLTQVNNKIKNRGYVFYPDGRRYEQDKTHLHPTEAGFVEAGDKFKILEIENVKIGLVICYEMEFPEYVRTQVLKGADIILCPSNTLGEHGFWRVRHCCQARAIENQIYVVHSCMVGTPYIQSLTSWGKSSILSPCEKPWPLNGVIAEAEANEEMVITGELDIKMLYRKRKRGEATTLNDRRPEIYEL
jgi:predicted amidohydrolase